MQVSDTLGCKRIRCPSKRIRLQPEISRNCLKKEELSKIAEILGGKFITFFLFPGGVIRKGEQGTGLNRSSIFRCPGM